MFAQKKALIAALFLVVLFFVSHVKRVDQFENSIESAKKLGLTEVYPVGEGVPFYAPHTLDPIWEDRASSSLVRLPSLQLIDQAGVVQTEKLFQGKVTFVAFFFTSCAGFCPTLLGQLQRVESRVKRDFPSVRFVAISVDPENDTPRVLTDYMKKRLISGRSWTLLTGEKSKIYELARETFAAEAFELPKSKGQVSHSEHFFVIDQDLRLRGVLKGTRLDVPESAYQLLSALKDKS